MKSEIIKYVYSIVRSKLYFIILFLFFLFLSFQSLAQTFSFSFNNTPLSEAISEVAQKANVRVSFDVDRLEQLTVTATINEKDVPSVLDTLLKNTGYYSEMRYDTYLIMRKKLDMDREVSGFRMLTGIIYDSETKERLPFANLYNPDHKLMVSSNVEGSFSLRIPDSDHSTIFEISYLGYHSLDTVIQITEDNSLIRIGLKQKVQAIE